MPPNPSMEWTATPQAALAGKCSASTLDFAKQVFEYGSRNSVCLVIFLEIDGADKGGVVR
jgi:hypothetical protein